MGLRSRIFSGFGVLVALGLAMAGYGYYGLSNIASEGVKKTASVQTVSATTSAAAQSMQEVLAVAAGAKESSQTVLTAAGAVGKTANTLRTEVTDFLSAMSSGDEAERLRYERCPGNGTQVIFRIAGQPEIRAEVVDISRSGIAVRCQRAGAAGTDAVLTLPGHGPVVTARIARVTTGTIGFAFRQDSTTSARVDQAMDTIAAVNLRAA